MIASTNNPGAPEITSIAGANTGAAISKPFDYTKLAPDVAEALRKQTARIRERIKTTAGAIIEIGCDLLAVKQQLDGRWFCEWVNLECGFNIRTAQRYMQAAKFAEG